MVEVSTIGLDLAKQVFQVHGVDAQGAVVLRRALRRGQMEGFFTRLAPCLIGMEACATSHHWARVLRRLGHEVRLIPPSYAKAYVRRNKNDAADAAAICEAVSRPSMRFVAVKSEAQQAVAGLHKARELLVKQRVMLINHLRAMLAEFGVVVGTGRQHVGKLSALLADPEERRVPAPLRETLQLLMGSLSGLERRIAVVERQLVDWGRADQRYQHLISIPGFGPILASAMAALVGDPAGFRNGREFSASLGLVPRQTGTGGKVRLGRISKRGNGYLRRLLVTGAMAALRSKWGLRDPWLRGLLATKPRKLAAVALANKLARIAWAVMSRGEMFRSVPEAA
jgi:transposase